MNNYWLEKQEDPKFWEREPASNNILSNLDEIEPIILDWLKQDDGGSMITFKCEGAISSIQFVRSEINIKTAFNVWQVWRIASSCQCNKIVSYLAKDIGTNDCEKIEDGFRMPNEVRTENYGPKEKYIDPVSEEKDFDEWWDQLGKDLFWKWME